MKARTILPLILLVLMPVTAAAGENDPVYDAWFRQVRYNERNRLTGLFPVAPESMEGINAYRMTFNDRGRPLRVEYTRSGKALADPAFGVPVIEISYQGDYIRRRYLDSRGRPVPDHDGVYSERLRRDADGRIVAVFRYDRYGNLRADRNGVAALGFRNDGEGRPLRVLFFDVDGSRVSDSRGVYETSYLYSDQGFLAEERWTDEAGRV